jgi:molybdate transport system substrate-binding protein
MIARRAAGIAVAALVAATALAADRPAVIATAASLREVATEAADALSERFGEDAFAIQTGGAAMLARQIERGSPAVALLSTSPEELDALERDGLLAAGTRRDLATNALVLIAPPGTDPPADLDGLADPARRRVAIANPRTAPAGRYARDALVAAHAWDEVEPRAVYGENVRQVLEYVARGDADAGIVYRSDVATFPGRVSVGGTVPADLHPTIRVQAALLRRDDARPVAFLRWLASSEGRAAFARLGFGPP